MTRHILMIVTSHDHISPERPTGLWFEEFAVPYTAFRDSGYTVTVASPKGGQAPVDPNSYPNEQDQVSYREALVQLENTKPITAVSHTGYDAVFVAGGHGTMFDLPVAAVGQIIGQFADANKVVAAVCHGPAGLVAAQRTDGTPVVSGYRVTGFTNAEEEAAHLTADMPFLLQNKLTELGAAFVAGAMWTDHVIVDRQLITGQNPQSSKSTAKAVIDLLERIAELS